MQYYQQPKRPSSFVIKFLGFLLLIVSLGIVLSIFPFFQQYTGMAGNVNAPTMTKIYWFIGGLIGLAISFYVMKS